MCARAFVPLVFLILGTALWAQDEAPAVVVRPIVSTDGDDMARALTGTFGNLLVQKGFVLVDGKDHPARFEAQGVLSRDSGNLILQVSVTDLAYRSVVAAQGLSVFDGLTALDPINDALASVTAKAWAYWEEVHRHPLPVPAVQDSLVFLSSDEGAEVFWKGHESLGRIEGGRVRAPYYPFPSNGTLTVTVEKPGFRPQSLKVALSTDKIEYSLPKLEKLRTEELHLFVSTGRLLGLGLEYRNYFLPDWAFWSAEAYPFVQFRPDVKTSRPVYHLDTAGSVGTWLVFPGSSSFRFGVEASVGLSQTYTVSANPAQWYLDATISPFGLLMEWKLWGLTIENRLQVPYSLGLPSGLLPARWLLIDGSVPLLSLGTVLRW